MLLLRRKGTDCVRASPDLSGCNCPSTAKLTWWWSCLHILHAAQQQLQQDHNQGAEGGGGRGGIQLKSRPAEYLVQQQQGTKTATTLVELRMMLSISCMIGS